MPPNDSRGSRFHDVRPAGYAPRPSVARPLPPARPVAVRTHWPLVLIAFALAVLSACAALATAYLILHHPEQTVPSSSTPSEIVAAVAKLTNLPAGETPQVVTISDLAPFAQEPFFRYAKPGDVLLVYIQNHVAIIFSPIEDKIVNMSRISAVIPSVGATP